MAVWDIWLVALMMASTMTKIVSVDISTREILIGLSIVFIGGIYYIILLILQQFIDLKLMRFLPGMTASIMKI